MNFDKRRKATLKHSAKVKRIKRAYGSWQHLLGDRPVRQREDILYEDVVPQATKYSSKFTGNQ